MEPHNTHIPKVVIQKAQELIELYGRHIVYEGIFENKQVYMFVFPEDEETGYPVLFLFDEHTDTVEIVSDFDAFDILDALSSN